MATYLVYEWPWEKTPAPPETDPSVAWAAPDSLMLTRLFAGEPERLRAQSHMLADGYHGLLCVLDDQWVAYGWMKAPHSPGPPHLPAQIRRLPCHWITYCRTRPEVQRRGIFTAMILELVAIALAKDPAARIFIDAKDSNHPSLHAIVRAGFLPAGVIRTVSLGFPRLGRVVWGSWRDR